MKEYLWISTLMFIIGGATWSQRGWGNTIIKAFLLFMGVWGVVLLCAKTVIAK